ncbi:aspartate/glutamate racemase family protein [Pseudothermotoga thermarum]|uniref:aspartate/glutamate racemase family protein n=1 Tax=Pseudothermotoga thermarum TaxID=119394 RepID=UPI00059E12E8|nr:amino acid racemase [Pseudothermotoga thermarum]
MKVPGIVGGMGSLSTVDFLQKVVSLTKADKDQDHLKMVVDFNTAVPDRTTALLYGGEDPTPYLVDSVNRLAKAGADFAVFICNTAYAFLEKVRKQAVIPVLNLPELTVERLCKKGIKRFWLTGTKGLIKSGVYQVAAEKFNVEILIPTEEVQDNLMTIIYSVKAGNVEKAKKVWEEAVEPKLEGYVLLGCTELPVVARSERLKLIDVNLEWAKIVIELCGKAVKEDETGV